MQQGKRFQLSGAQQRPRIDRSQPNTAHQLANGCFGIRIIAGDERVKRLACYLPGDERASEG